MSLAPVVEKTSALPRKRRLQTPVPRVVGAMSYEQYADLERQAGRKHQLIQGVAVEMPRGSPEHALIMGDIQYALESALRTAESNCILFPADMAIYISKRQVFYADVIVSGPAPQYDERDRLRNPVLVVEVLSPSTQNFDRDAKFKAYQTLPSLGHYILVSQHEVFVTHYAKSTEGTWEVIGMHDQRTDTLTIALEDATISVSVADIYRRVRFDAE